MFLIYKQSRCSYKLTYTLLLQYTQTVNTTTMVSHLGEFELVILSTEGSRKESYMTRDKLIQRVYEPTFVNCEDLEQKELLSPRWVQHPRDQPQSDRSMNIGYNLCTTSLHSQIEDQNRFWLKHHYQHLLYWTSYHYGKGNCFRWKKNHQDLNQMQRQHGECSRCFRLRRGNLCTQAGTLFRLSQQSQWG